MPSLDVHGALVAFVPLPAATVEGLHHGQPINATREGEGRAEANVESGNRNTQGT